MAILTTCESTELQTDSLPRPALTVESIGDGMITVIVDPLIPSHIRSSEPGSPCIEHASTATGINAVRHESLCAVFLIVISHSHEPVVVLHSSEYVLLFSVQ